MDGYLQLSPKERKTCLATYRAARAARRALVLVLLAEGRSYRAIGAATLASPTLVRAVRQDYAEGGLDRALGRQPRPVAVAHWLIVVVRWLLQAVPRDFGFFRTRWSCGLLAVLLREEHGLRLSPETIRRGLHRMEFVWRRPRPVVGPCDPEHAAKLRRIRRLLAGLPADETAVFQDEVDVHLNPKIGACWMPRGQQAEVCTPGNNEKRHLAGSLHWRTGRLLLSAPGRRRDAQLSCSATRMRPRSADVPVVVGPTARAWRQTVTVCAETPHQYATATAASSRTARLSAPHSAIAFTRRRRPTGHGMRPPDKPTIST
jgi:transposase